MDYNKMDIKKKIGYIVKHDETLIFCTAFIIEIIFGLILINKYGSTFFDVDAVSHVYNARNAIDNGIYSGLAPLVGTWLPGFELSQLPFVVIDKLYTTGFSGTIVNAAMTGGISVFLYKLFGGKNNRISILMPVIFLSNIYVLIFGVIPMTEQMAILSLVATAYFLKRYLDTGETKEFINCSLTLILGSFVKYEIWIVAIFVVSIFLIKEVIRNRNIYKIGYAHLPLWGIIGWLFTNFMIHKDPLWFNDNPLSNDVQMIMYPPYFKGSIFLTIQHAFIQMNMTFGIVLYLAVISIAFILIFKKTKWIIPLTVFFIPAALHLVLMYEGKSAGLQRYFYTPMPGMILSTGIMLDAIISTLNTNKNIINDMYRNGYRKAEYYFNAIINGANDRHILDKKIFVLTKSVSAILLIAVLITVASSFNSYNDNNNLKDPPGPISENSENSENSLLPNSPWIYQGLDISNHRIFFTIPNEKRTFVGDLSFEFLQDKNKNYYNKVKTLIGEEKILLPSFVVTDTDEVIIASTLSVSDGISPKQIVDGFDYLEYEKTMAEPWNYVKFVTISNNVSKDGAERTNRLYNGHFYLYNYYYNETWRSEFFNHYDLVFEDKDKLYELKPEFKIGVKENE